MEELKKNTKTKIGQRSKKSASPDPVKASSSDKKRAMAKNKKDTISKPEESRQEKKSVVFNISRHPGAEQMLKIEKGCCLWPIGDPRDKGFRFCGKPAIPGSAYCEEHHQESLTKKNYKRHMKKNN